MVIQMEGQPMSCRCIQDKWLRDRMKQADLAKKTARLTGQTQVLYRKTDGTFAFCAEGDDPKGEIVEIITQY